tara:strand:- start:145 stop:312 length:168 start_codon:yes stop_codon:yes gene_type:complete
MSWKKILKEDKIYISWLSDKKLMAHVDGRGPFEAEEVNAMISKNPEKYIQSISRT